MLYFPEDNIFGNDIKKTHKSNNMLLKSNLISLLFGKIYIFGIFGLCLIIIFGILYYNFEINIFDIEANSSFLTGIIAIMTAFLTISIIGILFGFLVSIYNYINEIYEISEDKIFYSSRGELNINEIIQIKVKTGFVEKHLFNTGSIIIETSSNKKSQIIIKAIKNPLDFYKKIQEIMQNNGFKIKKEKLIIKDKIHFFVMLPTIIMSVLFLIPIIVWLIIIFLNKNSIIDYFSEGDLDKNTIGFFIYFLYGVLIIIIILTITNLVIYLLNTKKSVYKIYDDSIFFEGGFFEKNYFFIPIESIISVDKYKQIGIYNLILTSKGTKIIIGGFAKLDEVYEKLKSLVFSK